MQHILNPVKRLGIVVALERLERPVGNETQPSDSQSKQPKVGSFQGHPEIKIALFTRQRKNMHAYEWGTRRGLGQAYKNVREQTETGERRDQGNGEPLDEGNSDEEGVDPDEAACK